MVGAQAIAQSWRRLQGLCRDSQKPKDHIWTRWVFLRLLGVTYLAAFISLWTQIDGLAGKDGIMPAAQLMDGLRTYCDQQGIGLDRYRLEPTFCWFSARDASLHLQCGLGVVFSVLAITGVFSAPCLFLLWALYLSLTTVSGVFLGYQWDSLLLEVGFLAVFLAPTRFLSRPSREETPSKTILWLFRWLLFRLMFASGCVKLLSGDSNWRNLTALNFHYETQPLPTWMGWYAHQLPIWFQKSSVAVMFMIELVIPFFIFLPRPLRVIACGSFISLEMLISLTGNYCFFNMLTVALCLLLLDDALWLRLIPEGLRRGGPAGPAVIKESAGSTLPTPWPHGRVSCLEIIRRIMVGLVTATILIVSIVEMLGTLGLQIKLPLVMKIYSTIAPFRSVNGYGLFAVMTTSRREIVMEGSNDARNWQAYEFNYKPGDPLRRPRFVAPHQPRLDWQMWFEALSEPNGFQASPWFLNFCQRLLQGSPPVLKLMARNPFPEAPPRYLRASVYNYHFTDLEARRKDRAWWRREFEGYYLPPISLPKPPP